MGSGSLILFHFAIILTPVHFGAVREKVRGRRWDESFRAHPHGTSIARNVYPDKNLQRMVSLLTGLLKKAPGPVCFFFDFSALIG